MAIQPMALQVANPEINAVQAMAQGRQAAQTIQNNSLVNARQALQNIGSLAFGVMGGDLNGQADPQRWEQALDMLASTGMDVEAFRGKAYLAPVVAKASVDTLGQLQLAQNERELEQRIAEFGFTVSEAAKGPAPTTDMQNFALSQQDPAFAEFLAGKDAPNPPSDVAEYNFYAEQEKAAGREPLAYLDYIQAQKGNGLSVTLPDGTVVQQGGKLTEAQSKDTVFATRAEGALPILNEFGNELMNPVARAVEGDPTGIARGELQSPEFQQAQQAGLEFLQAILRKDTGAAITPQEQTEYGRVYLPMPGDSPEVLAQKQQSRVRAVEAIKAGMPPQAILNQEIALQNSGSAAPASAPQSDAVIDYTDYFNQ